MLIFDLSMILSLVIKASLDYSVYPDSAAAFALSRMKEKYLEVDIFISKQKNPIQKWLKIKVLLIAFSFFIFILSLYQSSGQ